MDFGWYLLISFPIMGIYFGIAVMYFWNYENVITYRISFETTFLTKKLLVIKNG